MKFFVIYSKPILIKHNNIILLYHRNFLTTFPNWIFFSNLGYISWWLLQMLIKKILKISSNAKTCSGEACLKLVATEIFVMFTSCICIMLQEALWWRRHVTCCSQKTKKSDEGPGVRARLSTKPNLYIIKVYCICIRTRGGIDGKILPKGSNKKKEEKVGLCPTFGDLPRPPSVRETLNGFYRKKFVH